MQIKKIDHIDQFLALNEELLLKKESFYNLMLGLAYNIQANKIKTDSPLFYSILDQGRAIGCALRSNADKPLIVSEMPSQAISLLVAELTSTNEDIQAVVGEEATAGLFKDKWAALNDLDYKIDIHLGVFECFRVIFPKEISTKMILATDDHVDILRKYLRGFCEDCFPERIHTDAKIEELMINHLKNKSAFLLQTAEGEIVSMAASTRSTKTGTTISYVYTPKELRGHGYASMVVAMISQQILDSGKKMVNLFTDLLNPTSNSIYQKIGFIKIGQNIHYEFKKKGPG
jgi:predicted GNAT family acetyltransferase